MNQKLRLFIFVLGTFFCIISTSAWAHTIKGRVTDGQTGAPLVGASVMILGTSEGTTTNAAGVFVIHRDDEKLKLHVSFIGYETLEIEAQNDKFIEISLKPTNLELGEITVMANPENPLQTLSQTDIHLRPTQSSQEILKAVSGLVIAQHAGGGKAEQIFLRGFDIDHGTDIRISTDGIPVNMVSHAHGQGYADLHFIIPELIDNVEFEKGTYEVSEGNLATAGFVRFHTKKALDQNFIKLESGKFNTLRTVAGVGFSSHERRENLFFATEFMNSEGYFESSQNFNRLNLLGKYTRIIDEKNYVEAQFSTFRSRWDASGQIPERAVRSGQISRLGAIDDTEGGNTGRTNANLTFIRNLENGATLENQLFFVNYDFELYSNFTFFLENPETGDQIRQKEKRSIYGYRTRYQNTKDWKNNILLKTEIGGDWRTDYIQNNELSSTQNRQTTLERLAFGDVQETNAGIFAKIGIEKGKFSGDIGLRGDYFQFEYVDFLQTNYQTLSENQLLLSPKMNLNYDFSPQIRAYFKTGMGFHSNDSRVVTAQTGEKILPRAYGFDIGGIFKPTQRLLVHLAGWYLFSEQEFVYVGDAGIVEPSGESQRLGIDLSARWQLSKGFFADFDVNWTQPKALNEPEDADFIPLAPTLTSSGGFSFQLKNGLNGSFRYRYLDDRPANETNSMVAEGWFLADLVLNYTKPRYEIGLTIENLFDTEWKEAQFDTESRLSNETESVSEIHYTPGTPFFPKARLTYFF